MRDVSDKYPRRVADIPADLVIGSCWSGATPNEPDIRYVVKVIGLVSGKRLSQQMWRVQCLDCGSVYGYSAKRIINGVVYCGTCRQADERDIEAAA